MKPEALNLMILCGATGIVASLALMLSWCLYQLLHIFRLELGIKLVLDLVPVSLSFRRWRYSLIGWPAYTLLPEKVTLWVAIPTIEPSNTRVLFGFWSNLGWPTILVSAGLVATWPHNFIGALCWLGICLIGSLAWQRLVNAGLGADQLHPGFFVAILSIVLAIGILNLDGGLTAITQVIEELDCIEQVILDSCSQGFWETLVDQLTDF